MKFNSYRFISRATLISCVAYLLYFVLYYLSNFIYPTETLAYVWLFVSKSTYLLFPLISASLVLIVFVYKGGFAAVTAAIPLSLARLVHLIPSYYLTVIQEGYDSVESLVYGSLLSLGETIILFGIIMLAAILTKLFIEKVKKRDASDALATRTVLDFADPVSLAFILLSVLCCIYLLVGEVIDTVYFITEFGTRFTLDELIYLVISYSLDVIVPLSYYFVLAFIKNKVIAARLISDSLSYDKKDF